MVKSLYDISEFETVKFFDMTLHYINMDNEVMYLVSDLVRQYNVMHGTKKYVKKYISSKNLLNFLHDRFEEAKGTHREKTCTVYCGRLRIPGIIYFITYTNRTVAANIINGYVVCEQLMYDILTWVDKAFSWNLFTFLKDIKLGTSKDMQEVVNNLQQLINERDYQNRMLQDTIDSQCKNREKQNRLIEDKDAALKDLKAENIKLTTALKDTIQRCNELEIMLNNSINKFNDLYALYTKLETKSKQLCLCDNESTTQSQQRDYPTKFATRHVYFVIDEVENDNNSYVVSIGIRQRSNSNTKNIDNKSFCTDTIDFNPNLKTELFKTIVETLTTDFECNQKVKNSKIIVMPKDNNDNHDKILRKEIYDKLIDCIKNFLN
mgnify:FL=1